MNNNTTINISTLDANAFAEEILHLTCDNLTYAARMCGLSDAQRRGHRSTDFSIAIIEVLRFAQGHRKATGEIADAIHDASCVLWAVPEGEQRRVLEEVLRISYDRLSRTPLETEDSVH